MLIEDNDDARAMLHETLAFNGHEVRAARDGASIALAAESIPDIALIDIGLPDVDGYEVARACALRRADAGTHRDYRLRANEDQRRATTRDSMRISPSLSRPSDSSR